MNKNGVYGLELAFGAGFAAFADDLATGFFATAFLAAVFCLFGALVAFTAGFAAFVDLTDLSAFVILAAAFGAADALAAQLAASPRAALTNAAHLTDAYIFLVVQPRHSHA